CHVAVNALAANPYDVPFVLVYLMDDDAREAQLLCASGMETFEAATPERIALNDPAGPASWPLRDVFETGAAKLVSDLEQRFGSLPGGPWPESCETALILPIAASGHAKP